MWCLGPSAEKLWQPDLPGSKRDGSTEESADIRHANPEWPAGVLQLGPFCQRWDPWLAAWNTQNTWFSGKFFLRLFWSLLVWFQAQPRNLKSVLNCQSSKVETQMRKRKTDRLGRRNWQSWSVSSTGGWSVVAVPSMMPPHINAFALSDRLNTGVGLVFLLMFTNDVRFVDVWSGEHLTSCQSIFLWRSNRLCAVGKFFLSSVMERQTWNI